MVTVPLTRRHQSRSAWVMLLGCVPRPASRGRGKVAGNVTDKRRRGRPPRSDGADTRQEILRVARLVFSELGYERTTFQEIATRAGLTRPAVNHYFRDKAELY